MKGLGICLGVTLFVGVPLQATALQPLNVAVDTFSPPFVMQANNQFYGFDIAMMQSICQIIQRECIFQPMALSQLIDAVESNKADVAVGGIAISPERAERVNFSQAYLPSLGRFVMTKKLNQKPFTLDSLAKQTIGIEAGTLFPQTLASLPIDNPRISEYPTAEALIDALKNGDVTYVAADNPGAMFWQAQTSGEFVVLGEPFNYGFGLGIAVNKSNMTLLAEINRALTQYLGSAQFKANYNSYLNYF